VTLVTQRSSPHVCSIVEFCDYSNVPQCADAPWMLLSDYAVGKACREGYGGLNEEGALAPV
jgi:hypothetical protein